MPRLHHSASSIGLAIKCERAWAYSYIDGMRSPETKAQALGTAMHAVGEAWYKGGAPNWKSDAGLIFLSGSNYLPHPHRCLSKRAEREIGSSPAAPGDTFKTCLNVDGIRWVGKVDLFAHPHPAEAARLGCGGPPASGLTVDYKSSSDVDRYAKTPAELRADVQANIYAVDLCQWLNVDIFVGRWVYFQTKGPRYAKPVDFQIELAEAEDRLFTWTEHAKYLDTLETSDQATQNPGSACEEFGGCSYHHSRGGPCSARRRLGALIQARVPKKEDPTMGKFADRLAANRATAPAAAPPPPPAPEPTPEPPPAAAPPKRGPGRPPASAAAPAAQAPTRANLTCELRFTGDPADLAEIAAMVAEASSE